jgi:hypothetical protein
MALAGGARAWLAACATCLVACGGAAAPARGMLALELGGAASDGSGFLPLGGDVALIPGAQGGFHVWLKYRVFQMAPRSVRVVRSARRVSDGRAILDALPVIADIGAPGPEGDWQSPAAMPSFMCPTPIGVQVRDEAVELRLELRDSDGALLIDGTAEVVPRCLGDSFCERICSG